MATADENAIATLITVAQINAQAQYYAAVQQATATVQAHVQAAQIQADAERDVAETVAGWQNIHSTAEVDAAKVTAAAHVTATQSSSQAEVDSAKIRADAEEYAADRQKEWQVQVEQIRADAARAVAQTEATATSTSAQFNLEGLVQAAQIRGDADRAVAVTGAAAEVQRATIEGTFAVQAEQLRADASRDVATIAASNQVAVATIEANSRVQAATIEGQFRVQTAQAEGVWHVEVAQIEAAASNYRADQELAGVVAHEAAETSRLNIKLAFAQSIYDQIKPIIQQIVDAGTTILTGGAGFNPNPTPPPQQDAATPPPMGFRMSAGAGNAFPQDGNPMGFYARRTLADAPPPTPRAGPLDAPQDAGQGAGGSSTTNVTVTAPYIATRGVFTPAMLQQQVNQAYARNDARTQTQIRKAQGDLAGRGFSSNSPILDALQVGYVTSNLRASIEAASQIRLNAAQANVDAVFRGQSGRSDQFIKQEDVLVSAARVAVERQVGILQAVASLVGGVL